MGDALEAGGGGAACERTGGPAVGVPQPSQNACPSANGLPQFLQKPAIFASQNFSAQVPLYVLCIVPEAQSTGKRHAPFRCGVDLWGGVRELEGKRKLATGDLSAKNSVETDEQVE